MSLVLKRGDGGGGEGVGCTNESCSLSEFRPKYLKNYVAEQVATYNNAVAVALLLLYTIVLAVFTAVST